ncbi:MAG: hypothetical protein KIT83_09625 [Bryobacterales bacterium]|nr:hypothetical protein [Bryobacterales bacterium]
MIFRMGIGAALLAFVWMVTCTAPDAAGPATAPAQQDSPQADDCVRGEPAALLASGSSFAMHGAREALETVSTGKNPSLVIRHYGCAHYVLDFTFTWPETAAQERAAGLRAAAERLAELKGTEATGPILRSVREGILKLADDPASAWIQLSEMETLTVGVPSPAVLVITYDVAL